MTSHQRSFFLGGGQPNQVVIKAYSPFALRADLINRFPLPCRLSAHEASNEGIAAGHFGFFLKSHHA